MTQRREFLKSMSAAGLLPGGLTGAGRAPRVEVATTVFHAHPNAERTLVRFRGLGLDAPAGRLRIFGSRGQLLGTAGVIQRGDHLYGESWLKTDSIASLTTQLEAPGLARPLRTRHRLAAKPRWTVHWITVADPFEIEATLAQLSPPNLAVALAVLARSQVMANPLAVHTSWAATDHLAALRSSLGARDLERRWHIPPSPVAIADRRLFDLSAAPMILAGNGVEFAFVPGVGAGLPFQVAGSADGSRVIIAETSGGSDARSLGFAADRDAMAAAVERWLENGPTLVAPDLMPHTAVILTTAIEREHATMLARVEEWNSRFAYPRIVMGGIGELTARAAGVFAGTPKVGRVPPTVTPAPRQLRLATTERREALTARLDELIEPLRHLTGGTEPGAAGWLDRARFPFAGHVVFNPSPFSRSDFVRYPDGVERLATNIPAIGYAYTPALDRAEPPPTAETGRISLSGSRFDVRLDSNTGSISSLFERATGREWSGADRGGLNFVENARVEEVRYERREAGASQLIFSRRSAVGRIHTTITVYDDNPWIDVVNRTESERIPVDYRFAFAGSMNTIAWETPGGYERQPPPTGARAHLRWMSSENDDGRGLLRSLDSPYFRAETAGDAHRIVSLTSGGRARYRIDVAGPFAASDSPWRFGWDAEPFVVYQVETGGTVDVPSFGRVLRADPLTIIAGVRMADEGFAVMVYLQNPMNFVHTAELSAGVVQFETSRLVDYVERDLSSPIPVIAGTAQIKLPPHGIVAVRLSGIGLAEG